MTLRKTLLQLVVAATALPGCPVGYDCPDSEVGDQELTEPLDAELQALVDQCRDAGGYDFTACEPMCRELILRETGAAPFDDLSDCTLYDDADPTTAATAIASWTIGPQCIGGRRPAGYACGDAARDTIGGFLAEQARLEAASVRAFLDLARALAAHGAPRVLVDACRRAAAEEVVHAVLTGRLARRFGATPAIADAAPAPAPSLEELARANAVEGCVRETWGAVVATWQARAAHPAIRAAMQRIAPDETKHATLSRVIDRWAMRRLDPAARARVDAARAQAIDELGATIAADAPPALGLPTGDAARALWAGMSATMTPWPRSSSAAARS